MNENKKMAETEKLFKAVEIAEEKFEEYFAELQDSSQKIFAELQDSLQKIFDCEHPDLAEKERSYLFSIIKPFRDRVIYIGKFTEGDDTDKSFIEIGIDEDLEIGLPVFPNNQMYLGMKEDKKYTLEELGL